MDNQVNAFPRGKTWYNGSTIDTSNYGGIDLEGARKVFLNTSAPSTTPGVTLLRDGGEVRAICVRNTSGAALLPKRTVSWATGYRGRRVDGYTVATYQECAGVVDDQLPAAGVPNGDLFWLIVGGPCLVKTPLAGSEFGTGASFTEGGILFALTAVTSGATTSGRLQQWNGTFVNTSTTDGTAGLLILNHFARCMSAMTSGQTNTDYLIDIKHQW